MKYLEHKGYTGSIEYSAEDGLLYGKVLGLQGLISYEVKQESNWKPIFSRQLTFIWRIVS